MTRTEEFARLQTGSVKSRLTVVFKIGRQFRPEEREIP